MTRKAIAVIALSPGEIGYYDDYSRIYLSNSSPRATIYSGTNLYQIRKSIKSGRLRLVEGSLVEGEAINNKGIKPENTEIKPISSIVEEKKPAIEIEVVKEHDVKEQIPVEKKETEAVNAPDEQIEEKRPAKRSRKSKKVEETAAEG